MSFEQVFPAREVRLEVHYGILVLLSCFLQLHIIDRLLTLKQLKTAVSCAEIARYADKVSVLGARTINDVLLVGIAQYGDGNGETSEGRRGVSTDNIDIPFIASHAKTFVEVFNIFHFKSF